ncbi:MAG: 1-deoxy-D-xylulose-5-phosphate reductoisomerase [Tindallia sp. MSAO_Bac2]|nr:MAG: 1-deoxy-D-xylulose-5-phosphate reductoisomerase [Tindallia sp. MSAO_Bac2]
MKNISILGSTGSIGKQTLDVVRQHPDSFQVEAMTAHRNKDLLLEQIYEFKPAIASITSKEDAEWLKANAGSETTIYHGMQGIIEAATCTAADLVLNSLVGSMGLLPTCQAIKAGKTLALANKESLVAGGSLVMKLAKIHNVDILPVDSEHSAIFQCLRGENTRQVSRIILTASGGPFRTLDKNQIESMDPSCALKHPNWSMGQKITIDSATMMNKGLEVIEAKWLFNLNSNQIDVLIHPESIIHSMVEFVDTSVIAQLGLPDMRVPIQFAISYPERIPLKTEKLNLSSLSQLNFEEADMDRFPNLKLAFNAMDIGGTMPCVLNAANEHLVPMYLEGKVSFYQMAHIIEKTMHKHKSFVYESVQELHEVEEWVEEQINAMVQEL